MKSSLGLMLALLFAAHVAQAGVIVGGTRLIYDGNKKESSLSVSNPDKKAYLVQTWVESIDGTEPPPFVVTPPLFRLDGGQDNLLRVVRAGGNLPSDKESLFWMNIKAIPSAEKESDRNTLQIAIKARIKLIYRPEGLKGMPEDMADKLTWQRMGNELQVTNPTPFYMNFQKVKVAGKDVKEATFVAPGTTAHFALPAGVSSGSVSWSIINDFGGTGKEHIGTL
ncbi:MULTISPECIES: molecular chaperone [unclassified Serratia (in: enterobacteria)]|uniref:fimbrial biogenesis chaperone n=1 Tax=unclassified Serratia (in: enterobacteria) TaxID=2647522 RepID=UPI000503F0A1|nr:MULTISPECIES: fimbria/pilus periplasmic chaperone [unclassified Serratia (in: enterobacteria)]KFK94089.1 long polar fimbrial chaperone LpfB [Serratia sp. Ag2]KFL00574.1 long polar fimbrial chaperone LpfB [Serratia sp. Ag1]